MMTEKWTKWEPISGLAGRYNIGSISDSIEGFKIVLFDDCVEDQGIRLIFENGVDAYRCSDETYRLSTISALNEQHGKSFYGTWTFFKVMNSQYLKWLSEQSYGISDDRSLMHFSFIDRNSIFDVIAPYEPRVEFIK